MFHAYDPEQCLPSSASVRPQGQLFGCPPAPACVRGGQQETPSNNRFARDCIGAETRHRSECQQQHGPEQPQLQQWCSAAEAPLHATVMPTRQHMQQQQTLSAQQHQVLTAPAARPGHPAFNPDDSSVFVQQQLHQNQQSPDSSLLSGATLLQQCSTVGPQSSTLLTAGSTTSDLLSRIMSSLEDQVTKAIRPLVSQVIQQKLMQELSTQITHLADGTVHHLEAAPQLQQQRQVAGTHSDILLADQSGSLGNPSTPAATPAAACLSPSHDGSAASMCRHQLADMAAAAVAGSSNVVSNLLDTSGSSDPATISRMAADVMIGEQQQQQQRADTPATVSSNHSAWSPPAVSVGEVAAAAVTGPHQQTTAAATHDATSSLTIPMGSLPPLAVAMPGVTGSFGSTPATVHASSSSELPVSPFAGRACQDFVRQVISSKQQQEQQQQLLQGTVALSSMLPPQTVASTPAAAAAASPGSCEQQCVLSPGNSVCGAGTAGGGVSVGAMWPCDVNEEAMRELLADVDDPDQMMMMMSHSLVGTSSQQGPIPGSIFDDIDQLEELFADDEAPPMQPVTTAAAVNGACDTLAVQQQQQQLPSSFAVQPNSAHGRVPAAAAPRLVTPVADINRPLHVMAGGYSNHHAAAGTVASPAPAAVAAVFCKRPCDQLSGAAPGHTRPCAPVKRKRTSTSHSSSTSSNSHSGAFSNSSSHRRRRQQQHWGNRQNFQQQQQQQQQRQTSSLLSQLPSWLTKHVL